MNKSIAIFLMLMSPVVKAQDGSLILTACMGGYCMSNDNSAGMSPFVNTGNAELNEAIAESYRREYQQRYEQVRQQVLDQQRQWTEEQNRVLNLSPSDYQNIVDQTVSQMEARLNSFSGPTISAATRRQNNPYPNNVPQGVINQAMDEIWTAISSHDPRNFADKLNQSLESKRPRQGVSGDFNEFQTSQFEFITRELIQSQMLDGSGLVQVPMVEPFLTGLNSRPMSEAGFDVRATLNQARASRSVMEAKCHSEQAVVDHCRLARDFYEGFDMNMLAMDRWAQSFPFSEPSELFKQQMRVLNNSLAFAKGAVDGATDMVEGLAQVVLHPIDTAEALITAVYHYDKTYEALKKSLDDNWQAYLAGTEEERSAIYGRIGFEVVSALVPVSKVAQIRRVRQASKMAQKIMVEVGEKIPKANVLLDSTSLAQRKALADYIYKGRGRLGANYKVDDLIEDSRNYYSGWVGDDHKLLRDRTAEAVNRELREQALEPDSFQKAFRDNTRVTEVVTDQEIILWRAHGPTNQPGDWLAHPEELAGLSSEQIRKKLALKRPPTALSEVRVPAGTKIQYGKISPNSFSSEVGENVQYLLDHRELSADRYRKVLDLID